MTENESKQFNKRLRVGVGIMTAFVIPSIIIGLTEFSEWINAFNGLQTSTAGRTVDEVLINLNHFVTEVVK